MKRNIEAAIQAALIHWVKETYPLVMITATQNENSYKDTKQIGSLGITDLILFDVRDATLHCFFLELKKLKGKLLPSQKTWNTTYDERYGSCTNTQRAVAYGFLEAKGLIANWMSLHGAQYQSPSLPFCKSTPNPNIE